MNWRALKPHLCGVAAVAIPGSMVATAFVCPNWVLGMLFAICAALSVFALYRLGMVLGGGA